MSMVLDFLNNGRSRLVIQGGKEDNLANGGFFFPNIVLDTEVEVQIALLG